MEYNFNDNGCISQQRDLIDFLPESSVDVWEENSSCNTGPPVLKSKDRSRVNSDVVAIKSSGGDIAFVAVGRPGFEQRSPITTSQHPERNEPRPAKVKQHRKSSSNDEKFVSQSGSFPRMMANPSEGGIDNFGYQTLTRNESYTYDDTGFNYYSHLDRNDDPQLVNSISQPQYVRIDTSQETKQRTKLSARSGSYGDIPSTSRDIISQPETHETPRSQQGVSEGRMRARSSSQQQSSSRSASETTATSNENAPRSRSTSGRSSRRQSRDLDTVLVTPEQPSPVPKLPPLCKTCGQNHGVTENHEYNYVEEPDEDLMCDICLQALVDPYDTVCGHTFCNICLKNYLRVKNICPVDRVDLTNSSTDCWQSSLVLRKLVNKLKVTCPNEEFCKKKLQRCDLKEHLQDICSGAVIRCPKSMYGCSYRGPRCKMEEHLKECAYKDFTDKLSDLHPFSEDVTIELFRPEGTAEMGIMIVGGSDTPLHYIVIQDILNESLADQDGRLQVGDIVVEINGESMFSVTHAEARAALTKPSSLMRFTLLRDIPKEENPSAAYSESPVSFKEEVICLVKPPLEQLGIRISSGENNEKGVYIIELIHGQVAETDGRLLVGDRIMKIGDTDLSESTPERAARIISSCDREVKILVRHPNLKSTVVCNEWTDEENGKSKNPSLKRSESFITVPKMVKSKRTRKTISVVKSSRENLGIVVSGGNGSPRGNLPIFVQDVLPMSVLGKDKRIKRGDLLSEINSIKLTGLSHHQAMSHLRESAQQREVTLVVYELDYEGKAEDEALWDELTSLHQNPSKWAPSWKLWLAATRDFSSIKEIVLRRQSNSNYGFKITGGLSEETGPVPIFVTHVSKTSTANKLLKCGDEIVSINKRPVRELHYTQVLNLMRSVTCITLKVVSWPGSLH